jgi:hypothetical protein
VKQGQDSNVVALCMGFEGFRFVGVTLGCWFEGLGFVGLLGFFCGFALAFLCILLVYLGAPHDFFFNKTPYYLLKKKKTEALGSGVVDTVIAIVS